MLYIRPSDRGYAAFDVYHHPVFEEKDCGLLFSFLESGSEKLVETLEKYFEKRIDRETLAEKDGKVSKAMLDGIKKEMEQLHPYLAANHCFSVFTMLAEHLEICVYERDREQPISYEEYERLYRHLIQPLVTPDTHPLPPRLVPTSSVFIGNCYKRLREIYQKKVMPAGFRYIEKVQAEAGRFLYWVLDQSSFRFKDLDRASRIRLYSRVFQKRVIGPDLRFVNNYYWTEPEEYDYFANSPAGRLAEGLQSGLSIEEANDRARQIEKDRQDWQERARALALLDNDRVHLPEELTVYMDDEIAAAREETSAVLFEEFHVDSFNSLIQLQLWLLSKGETVIKRCRHCGRLFVAEKSTIDYCERIMEGETEPCNIVGPKKAFSRRLDEDHVLKIYNRAYKTIYTRMKRGSMSADDFNRWKAEARYMLDQTRAGEVSEAAFEAWLTQDIRSWGIGKPATVE